MKMIIISITVSISILVSVAGCSQKVSKPEAITLQKTETTTIVKADNKSNTAKLYDSNT